MMLPLLTSLIALNIIHANQFLVETENSEHQVDAERPVLPIKAKEEYKNPPKSKPKKESQIHQNATIVSNRIKAFQKEHALRHQGNSKHQGDYINVEKVHEPDPKYAHIPDSELHGWMTPRAKVPWQLLAEFGVDRKKTFRYWKARHGCVNNADTITKACRELLTPKHVINAHRPQIYVDKYGKPCSTPCRLKDGNGEGYKTYSYFWCWYELPFLSNTPLKGYKVPSRYIGKQKSYYRVSQKKLPLRIFLRHPVIPAGLTG